MIFFIVQWRISEYSSYFLELLFQLKKNHPVCLIESSSTCTDTSDPKWKSFFDHHIHHARDKATEELVEKMRPLLSKKNVIISHSLRNSFEPGYFLSQHFKVPHLLFEHLGMFADETASLDSSIAKKLRSVSEVIVPSEILEGFFKNYFENVHVSYLRPLPHFFSPLPEKTSKKRRILYVGKISTEKKILEFSQINSEFFKAHNLGLTIVGDGPLEANIDLSWIEVIGRSRHQEIVSLIDASLAVVLPSPLESYSMVVIESLLRGTPVLCQRTGIAKTLLSRVPGLIELSPTLEMTRGQLQAIDGVTDHHKISQLTKLFLHSKSSNFASVIGKYV